MVFLGDGWVGVERGKSGYGGKVGKVPSLPYLEHQGRFFVGR